jgi:hypothetical protein
MGQMSQANWNQSISRRDQLTQWQICKAAEYDRRQRLTVTIIILEEEIFNGEL